MDYDLVGIDAVTNVIQMSKLSKFVIHKYGAAVVTFPIFECLHCATHSQAEDEFQRWANNILNYNPDSIVGYSITIFEADEDNPNNVAKDGKPKRQYAKKIRTSFVLNSPMSVRQRNFNNHTNQNQQQQHQPHVPNGFISHTDMMARIQETIATTLAQAENKQLREEMRLLKESIEEVDDEEPRDYFGEAFDMAKVKFGFGNANKTHTPHLAGEPNQPTKGQRIIEAVKVMAVVDPNIDQVLVKLAKLAKENPTTFKAYINSFMAM